MRGPGGRLIWGTGTKEALPGGRKGPLTCGGAKGTRTPNPLLANSPKGFRERVIEHTVGRCGVPDDAGFVADCSTFLGYDSGAAGLVLSAGVRG